MISNSLLVPRRAIFNFLGCICKNPKLLNKEGREVSEKDFEDSFLKIMFAGINNIYISTPTIREITAVDVDNYLAQQAQAYNIFTQNDGFKILSSAIQKCNPDLFDENYKIIKKFSLLRDFNNMGFDISDIYNPTNTNLAEVNKQAVALEKMDLQDIVDHFSLKLVNIKNDWNVAGNHRRYLASDGLDTLLDRLHQEPDYGVSFLNKYYNTIFRGMRFGKLMIKSAGTGVGKTRTALADVVAVSATEIWDFSIGDYVKQEVIYNSTFISTEIEMEQLQTCLLAIISGVNENVIKKGNYSREVHKRLAKAIEILKNSPITLHYINDFSMLDIENIIEQEILENDCKFVWFDYLQITPKLSRTIQEEYGMGLREDQIMMNFSSRLKNIAERYNIYISTATQLNRNSKERENRDATSIRGGSATIDKADFAVQLYKVTSQDLKSIEPLLRRGLATPNFMHIVYKNRDGEFNEVIIWSRMNHGNMREEVLFVTTKDYELIDVQPTEIKTR